MTIEKLLECSADQLEQMSDEELMEHFKPYLCITRPDLAPKPVNTNSHKSFRSPASQGKQNMKQMAMEILAKQGIRVKL